MADNRLSVVDLVAGLDQEWPEAGAQIHLAVLYLYRARDRLHDALSEVLQPFGLLSADLDVLAALRTRPPPHELTPTSLYRHLFLSSGGLTKILRRLSVAGLVDRPANPQDRRSRLVRLTPQGLDLLDSLLAPIGRHEEAFLAPLSRAERHQLAALLAKLVDHLDRT